MNVLHLRFPTVLSQPTWKRKPLLIFIKCFSVTARLERKKSPRVSSRTKIEKKAYRFGISDDGGTCFGTFPFPFSLGSEPSEADNEHVHAIAQTARDLVAFRRAWLHPPNSNIGTTISEKQLKKRTLTNLYNALTLYRDNPRIGIDAFKKATPTDLTLGQIEELNDIHCDLDHAVLAAYGWPQNLTDEQILERLLALNLERAAA